MSTLRAKDKLWNKLLVKNVLQQQLHSHSFYFQLFFRCSYLLSISTRFFADSSSRGITKLLIWRMLELWRNVCLRLDVIHYLIKKALIFKTPKYQAFSEIQMLCDFIEPIKLDDIKRGEDLRWPIWTCMIKL